MCDPRLAAFRATILRIFPALESATFRTLAEGWHSTAVEADGQIVFKFPRDEAAEAALVREAAMLAAVRPHLSLAVPDLSIHDGPPVFSRHEKIEGDTLLADGYDRLPETARQEMAETLARFYTELHRLDMDAMRAAGAVAVEPWQTPDEIRAAALPVLPARLRGFAQDVLSQFEALPPDPHGTVFGFFDGHGWNMAFDHVRQRLNGVFDFADSGFGPLHQDFIYSNLVSPDLTVRVVSAYETATGRPLDRRRIGVLTGMHRLSELTEGAGDSSIMQDMVRYVAEWAACVESGQWPFA